MIEPEFVTDERLPLIQNYEPDIDDSVYDRLAAQQEQDTQETSFAQQDETPRWWPISDTCNRLKAVMIESLCRHICWEIDENMIDLHLDRYQIKQENSQTILSFKKGGKWFNLTSQRTGGFWERNSIEKIITNTHLKNLGISILDITPTDLEMNDLIPQQLEDVVKKVTRTIGTNTEFLGIDKPFIRITGEIKKNVSKLTEIDEHLER